MPNDSLGNGPIAWMARHRVAPNLLMVLCLLGGLLMASQIGQQVFPNFQLDAVTVRVAYPGATPEDVEEGIILAVEEAVRGLDGIEEIRSTAAEGSGTVTLELRTDAERQQVYQDVQQAVDRITTFPDDIEQPRVSLSSRRHDVMDLQIYGEVDPWTLREAAERVRDGLLAEPAISQVELDDVNDYEIHVEIPQAQLRAHGLTFGDVAQTLAAASRDRGAGSVETAAGEILLRIDERREWAEEFAQLPLIANANGTLVRLGDIAEVRDGFAEAERYGYYNGHPAIGIEVYRIGTQTPVTVSQAVRARLPEIMSGLPSSIDYAIADDNAEIYQQRLQLLLKNGLIGLGLVFILLTVFLEFKLAFWVSIGIPTAFLGAFLFLPALGVTLNMVSMFAFIVALGIVVDDAIVAGENIYAYRQRGMSLLDAAVQGARDIAMPISFSILTNIIAFLPLAFIPGIMGQIWVVIPLVVGTVFLISWVEVLFILPAHLGHVKATQSTALGAHLHHWQQGFSNGFTRLVERYYGPFLRLAMRWRYVTVAVSAGVLAVVMAFPISGRMGFIFMPKVESDFASATATLPYGSAAAKVEAVREQLVAAARQVVAEHGGEQLSEGLYARVSENKIDARLYLTPPGQRPLSTAEVTRLWREATGPLPGLQSLRFASDRGGPGHGPSLSVELSHYDTAILDRASASLAERLAQFAHVEDIDDGYTPGKPQLSFQVTEVGRSLGLTAEAIAAQVRHAFYGAEALRQLRGRNEVKLLVRLPERERSSEHDVESLLIRTPNGGYTPLYEVAEVTRERAFTTIDRRQGRRVVTVTANVVPIDDTTRIMATLKADILPQLVADFPGLHYSFEGRQASIRDAMGSFVRSVGIGLLVIYALLAIPFRSYIQPIIVMIAIPFGLVGAVLGHMLMGFSLSVISIMGVIALGGVVINDALVMINYANQQRRAGATPFEAMAAAGVRRFRPILLTTLTTFGGLAPMIFETSRQARFLIPMAISLGYGILFATGILLMLIPALYMVVDDVLELLRMPVRQLGPARPQARLENG